MMIGENDEEVCPECGDVFIYNPEHVAGWAICDNCW